MNVVMIGATGSQGGAVVDALLSDEFRADFASLTFLTRNIASESSQSLVKRGCIAMKGDMTDRASLLTAFRSKDVLYFVTNPFLSPKGYRVNSVPTWEVDHGRNVVEAAKEAGCIRHIVFSSVGDADKNQVVPFYASKYEIEEIIRKSSIAYTMVRPVFFMDNWAIDEFGEFKPETGVIQGIVGSKHKLALVSSKDIGRAVAVALKNKDGEWTNKVWELSTVVTTGSDVALVASEISGRSIKWSQYPPRWLAYFAVPGVYQSIKWNEDVGFSADANASIKALGGSYTTLKDWLTKHLLKQREK